jgi:hypothetical protein
LILEIHLSWFMINGKFYVTDDIRQVEITMTATVQAMKKVSVEIRVGVEEGASTFTPEPVDLTFICGIGSGGLSPFELSLYGKKAAETIRFRVAAADAREFFAHLWGPVTMKAKISLFPPLAFFEVKVVAIVDAQNTEVVKALANSAAGCGGSCGCGCSDDELV